MQGGSLAARREGKKDSWAVPLVRTGADLSGNPIFLNTFPRLLYCSLSWPNRSVAVDLLSLSDPSQIRGGIPVVFPIFGPPPAADKIAADSRLEPHGRLSQHGFARTSVWTLEKETNEGVDLGQLRWPYPPRLRPLVCVLTFLACSQNGRTVLEPTDEIKKVFPQAFKLTYSVTLSASALTTALRISNASAEPLLFQTLVRPLITLCLCDFA